MPVRSSGFSPMSHSRWKTSLRPRPASTRTRVVPVPTNVQLPELELASTQTLTMAASPYCLRVSQASGGVQPATSGTTFVSGSSPIHSGIQQMDARAEHRPVDAFEQSPAHEQRQERVSADGQPQSIQARRGALRQDESDRAEAVERRYGQEVERAQQQVQREQ